MANPHRGEVELAGPDGPVTLRYSINALCEIEDALDKDIARIIAEFQDSERVSLKLMRALLWAGLRGAGSEATLEEAGDLMGAVSVPEVMAAIGEGLAQAFPPASGKKKRSGAARAA